MSDLFKAVRRNSPILGPERLDADQIRREIAYLMDSRKGWPGLDSAQDELVRRQIADLTDDLYVIEHPEEFK